MRRHAAARPVPLPHSDGLPFLLRCRVREATYQRYHNVVVPFLVWVMERGYMLSTAPDLDRALVHYAHSGAVTRSVFTTVIAAVLFFLPGLGHNLHCARETLKGWIRFLPTKHKAPMLFVFVVALAANLVELGFPRCAAGVIVQYGGFLRPGELVRLRPGDAILPEAGVTAHVAKSSAALLALGTSARGTKVNRQQVAKVRHPWAIAALRWLKRTATGPQLVGVTYAQYRTAFQHAADRALFRQAGLHFTPHCPRAGAATQGSLEGATIPDLKDAGRWGSEQSLKIYLDIATAMAARTLELATPYQRLLEDMTLVGPIFA